MQRRISFDRRDRRFLNLFHRDPYRRFRIKRHRTSGHLIHHHTQRIDIGLSIHCLSLGLFRRNIMHRAQNIVGQRHRRCRGNTRNAKIGNLDVTGFRDKNISRLNVSMHQIMLVSTLQRQRNLTSRLGNNSRAHRAVSLNGFL